jgi:predicted dehydrogenase
MIKALVVGYGYMGQIRARVAGELEGLLIAGVCDPAISPDETGLRCPHYKDYRTAIRELRPQLVFVCTPNSLSPEVCEHALGSGCHVFCEKPPGRSVEDVERIIAAESASKGLKVMFGFNHRHHPAILEAKSIVKAGRLGRILWLRGVYGKSGGLGRGFESSWRNNPEVSGGGILLDQGIHMLDLFRFFCGDFEEVHGMMGTRLWNISVEDNAFVMLRGSGGQMAQLHSSATLWKHTFELEIGLEHGYLIVHGLLSKTGSYGRETLVIGRRPDEADITAVAGVPREESIYFDKDMSWSLQMQEILRCIREDRPVIDSSTRDALKVMQLIESIYRKAGLQGTSRSPGELAIP